MSRPAATTKLWVTAIVTVLALLIPATAGAVERLTFTGTQTRDGKVTFKAAKLKGKKVRKLNVRLNGKVKKLTKKHAKRVVRSGVLRLRATRRGRPTKGGRTPYLTPAVDPAPSGTTAPAEPPVLVAIVAPKPTAKNPVPAPAPAPSATACPASEPAPGGGTVPSACWRPYGDHSPFNRRIADAPRVHARSGDFVANLMQFGGPQSLAAGTADSQDDWSHPTYYARSSDPLFTIHCAEDWGRCGIEGDQIRIPDEARAAAGGDGHMTVVDQSSGWEYDFWQVRSKPSGGGTITISWGGRTRIDGDGLGSAATAAGYANLAGVIRAPELAAGRINHALFMTFRCDNREHVYPAVKGGSHCADSSKGFPMGTRFQLDMSDAQIAALDIPAWKKTVLRAMAEYGMYFGDTGGSSWAVQLESGSTYTSFGLQDPVKAIARDAGVPAYDGIHWMDLAGGVDWRRHLRVLDPCTANGTC